MTLEKKSEKLFLREAAIKKKVARLNKEATIQKRRLNKLEAEQKKTDKATRTTRLCRRAGYYESLIHGAAEMSDAEFFKAVKEFFTSSSSTPIKRYNVSGQDR